MKDSFVNCGRSIATNHEAVKIGELSEGAVDFSTPPAAGQGATVLHRRLATPSHKNTDPLWAFVRLIFQICSPFLGWSKTAV